MENLPSQKYRKTVSPPSKKTYRNWVDLPEVTTLTILKKIGQLDILNSAQFVCKTWYTLCKDASLWQTIRIHNTHTPFISRRYDNMVINAVGRSAGGLVGLDIECFGSDELFACIGSRSTQLKHLRIADCRNSCGKALSEALKKLSSLQELELTLCSFEETVPIIHACCPSLTSFKLNKLSPQFGRNDEALAIAQNMPELRHLQLIGNSMTRDGLTAILDGCPRLQLLDLRACNQLYVDGKLRKKLSEKIKNLRLPNDSTEDYNYPTVDEDISSDDSDHSVDMYWDEFDPVFSDDDRFDEAAYIEYYSL